MTKELTISIAAYNVEKFLERTLESLVISKDYLERIEVIIVDDGSIDSTSVIAEKYCRNYPNSFRLIKKENGGYGSTVNCSIAQAQGKYFKQLDGDDWFVSENIELLIDYLSSCNADIVISPFIMYFESDETEKVIDKWNKSFDDNSLLQSNNEIVMAEMCIKTDILKKNNICLLEKCFYTDFEFVLYSMLNSKTFQYFSKPIYVYRIGREGQSISLVGIRKNYKDKLKVAMHVINQYTKLAAECPEYIQCMAVIKIKTLCGDVYNAFMLLDKPMNHYKEIADFNDELKKNHKEIYKETNELNNVRCFRIFPRFLYPVLCNISIKRLKDRLHVVG
jgi:glycosyltransferase involved in cell wall biosynthesis